MYPAGAVLDQGVSSVLFLLGQCKPRPGEAEEPCIVLNKRSLTVKQPGDLCFPGGRVMPRLDTFFAGILRLPFSPLRRWPFWGEWRSSRREEAASLAVLLSAGLRESLEEMRLNPLGLVFLGPMRGIRLSMFRRDLYPMVAWVCGQKRFLPNGEVDRVIHVPFRALTDGRNYVRYRLRILGAVSDFPCFRLVDGRETEFLWGVTYEMVAAFLDLAFSFRPPALESLPVVHGTLSEEYWKGAGP
jgi:8-oxo-dGTP pyrophosphatase MutT (NUDIX family)